MDKQLYIFTYTFKDGFSRPDFLYYAHSRLEVAERILFDMMNASERGDKLRNIFSRMTVADRAFGYDMEICHEKNEAKKMRFIVSRSPQELLDFIDASYVDGTSFARVTLCECKLDSIIDLTGGNKSVKPFQQGKPGTQEDGEVMIVDDAKAIAEMINCAFRDYAVSHLVWEGKSWYSHTVHTWREKRWVPAGEVGEHDPDHICYGYWGHVFDANAEDKDGDLDEEVSLPYEPLRVKKLEDVKHVFAPAGNEKAPKFDLQQKVCLLRSWHIVNDSGLNTDHRGSNHLGIEIDHLFDGSVDIDPGLYTFAKLADLIWRAKGNKFDNQYEMVFGIGEEAVELEENDWHVGLTVDHGS